MTEERREATPYDMTPAGMSEEQHDALLDAPMMPEPDLTGLRFQAGQERAVVSRCNGYREDVDQPCAGSLWAAPGDRQARCDTCRGWCGMGVLPDRWPHAEGREQAHTDCFTETDNCWAGDATACPMSPVDREPGREQAPGTPMRNMIRERRADLTEEQIDNMMRPLDEAGEALARATGRQQTPAELRALAAEIESRECTGEAASWCPVHGTCRGCVRRDDGEWDDFDANCPLHGQRTTHAAGERA